VLSSVCLERRKRPPQVCPNAKNSGSERTGCEDRFELLATSALNADSTANMIRALFVSRSDA